MTSIRYKKETCAWSNLLNRQKRGHGKITVTAAELHAESAFEMIKQDCEGYVRIGGNETDRR